jgi:hypothetical protein
MVFVSMTSEPEVQWREIKAGTEWNDTFPTDWGGDYWTATLGQSDVWLRENADGGKTPAHYYANIFDYRIPPIGGDSERKHDHRSEFGIFAESLYVAKRKVVEFVTTNAWRFGQGLRQVPGWLNLIHGAMEQMDEYDKTWTDVAWVGSRDGKWATTWQKFTEMDAAYEYIGGAPKDMVIVFFPVGEGNSWLELREYDGSVWWQYMILPVLRSDHKELMDLSQIGEEF